ncbi:hypothetical protein UFOVP1356_1 [uncultured Caudovirales phage]|uniref:Uncharacterized protein n=1 Tax=uncultured Caudovirales phage TaxID=2100421 RepID=A0A6J5S2I0_9CAUD|nr:hypothetical protein UFOVP1356_1 [uncultured Caudovirales phage]
MILVTLHDGRQVDSWSEAWRAECEARHILAMPNIHLRRIYLADVTKRRGEVAGKALGDLVRAVWSHARKP